MDERVLNVPVAQLRAERIEGNPPVGFNDGPSNIRTAGSFVFFSAEEAKAFAIRSTTSTSRNLSGTF